MTGQRVASAVVFLCGLAVLALAAWLEPDGRGIGTHEQLGLGTCTFLWLSGWPCPMCGGTTSWALMAEGRVLEALVTQPFGVLLFALLLALMGVAGAEAVRPAGRWDRTLAWVDARGVGLSIFFLVGMFVGWTFKIATVVGIF